MAHILCGDAQHLLPYFSQSWQSLLQGPSGPCGRPLHPNDACQSIYVVRWHIPQGPFVHLEKVGQLIEALPREAQDGHAATGRLHHQPILGRHPKGYGDLGWLGGKGDRIPSRAVGWESSRYAVVLSLEGEGLWRPAVSEHLHPLPEAREGLGGV
jgi:hypothetical protein